MPLLLVSVVACRCAQSASPAHERMNEETLPIIISLGLSRRRRHHNMNAVAIRQ